MVSIPPIAPSDHLVVQQPATAPNNASDLHLVSIRASLSLLYLAWYAYSKTPSDSMQQPTTASASTNTASPANATSTAQTSTGQYTTEEVDTLKSIIADDFGGQPFAGDWQVITDTFRQRQLPGRTLYGLRRKWYKLEELRKLEDERLASQDGK